MIVEARQLHQGGEVEVIGLIGIGIDQPWHPFGMVIALP